MKILYAVHQFFPERYMGTERYTLALSKQMQMLGHQVEVLTYQLDGAGGMEPTADPHILERRFTVERVPVVAWRHRDYDESQLHGVSFRIGDPLFEAALDRFLEAGGYELVHVLHPMRFTPLVEVAKRRGLPVVLHLTDFWTMCPRGILVREGGSLCEGPRGGAACTEVCFERKHASALAARNAAGRRLIELADVVVAPSRFLWGMFAEALGVDTGHFLHRSYGFDFGMLSSRAGRRKIDGTTITFGFLGTVLPHKGVDVLVKAFRKVDLPHLRLRIYGGYIDHFGYYMQLRALAEGDSRITFEGKYEFNDVGTILEGLDVVVVPSVWYENNPLVTGISHAAGVPVIATDLGGMTEMVHDRVNGLVFPIADAEALARHIRELGTDPALVEQFGRAIDPPPRIEHDGLELELVYRDLLDGCDLLVPEPFADR